MRKADNDPKVVQLARDLGIPLRGKLTDRIREYALGWVRSELASWPDAITTLDGLQRFLRAKLYVDLEIIHHDDDLNRIALEYDFSECQRRQLHVEFNQDGVEGWLIPRPNWKPGDRYHVAIADARGARSSRAFFTGWHEIVHIILTPKQLVLEGMRRTMPAPRTKDAVESIVDDVAGHLAFFEPIVRPALEKHLGTSAHLTFDVIEAVRLDVAPTASFFSTAIACVRLMRRATLVVQVDWAYKPSELRSLTRQSHQAELSLGAVPTPQRKLRIVDSVPNDVARSKRAFKIFQPMRVPNSSCIYDVAIGGVESAKDLENQNQWEASGSLLPGLAINVEATRRGRYTYALITAVE